MKKIRLCSLFIVLSFLLSFSVFAGGSGYADSLETAAEEGINAQSAVLICANNGQVIYSKDQDRHLPIASTTKIMTAVLTIENADLDEVITVDKAACGIEGSSVYLYEGEKISVRDLLYAVMLESANDASAALALEIGKGDMTAFTDMMNAKAYELGMTDSHFTNPHGLDNEDHYSSAHDMAILTCYALENDVFREIASTYKYLSRMNDSDETRVFINHNKLLNSYEGIIGGKTGYTKRSGRCLVSAAQRNGVKLVCVTLNDPDDWRDHTTLLDSGFDAYENCCFAKDGEYTYEIPVINGTSPNVYAEADPISVVLPKGSAQNIKTVCELDRFYYAGIKKGDVLGHLVFSLDGKEIARTKISAQNDVENIRYKSFFQKLFSIFIKD